MRTISSYKKTGERCGGKSPMTIRRWATDPAYAHLGFPKPIQLGDNSVGFDDGEIGLWLDERAALRDDEDERPP